jgi:hypothetical protein
VSTSELMQDVPGGKSHCAHWLRDMVSVPNGQNAFFHIVNIYIRRKSILILDFIELPVNLKNTTFRKPDLFPSSGENFCFLEYRPMEEIQKLSDPKRNRKLNFKLWA